MPVIPITTTEEYNSIIHADKTSVVLFTADWAEQCKQVKDVLEDLSDLLNNNLAFVSVTAENFPEISMKHQIDAVPTVIFFKNGAAIDRIDGVDISEINTKCKKLSATASAEEPLEQRLTKLINKAPLMIFMKGDRKAPRCGFSRQLIDIIEETKLPYETFDILGDEEVRQGLKTFSDWPTYPQVYVRGELIGGLDIIKELKTSSQLETTLKG